MRHGLIQAENDLMPEKSTSFYSSNEYLGVLDLYIEDALGKLSPFQTLHQKIDLFESILKEKVLAFKKVVIDSDNGFYFESLNGDVIDRNLLSSGEQNQIVLLFNLIFDIVSQKVILIDEPEISLHVAWQQTFLDSLKKIQKINKYVMSHTDRKLIQGELANIFCYDVKMNILCACYKIGLLKWYNYLTHSNLNFKGINYRDFVNVNRTDVVVDESKYINHVLSSQALPSLDGQTSRRKKHSRKKSQRSLNQNDMLEALQQLQTRGQEIFGKS